MAFIFDEPRSRKSFGKHERDALYRVQSGKCMYCGRKIPKDLFHIDHKTPFSRGGSDRLANLQLLCPTCNTRKGDMSDGEFRRRYRLGPSRGAKPPSKIIPQVHFDAVSKQVAARNARIRRRQDDFGF